MNKYLRFLLEITPGIIRTASGIICHRVDFKDWVGLLTMRPVETPKVGKWVQVRKGAYKGDVGYVMSSSDWGVELLLVPRLVPPTTIGSLPAKRKRGLPHLIPASALFDPVDIKQVYNMQPAYIQENIYSFNSHRYEHGLLVKTYDFSSVSSTHSIPLSQFDLFWESRHPRLVASESAFPVPLEWDFAEGDEVHIWEPPKPSYMMPPIVLRHGIITAVETDSVEVNLPTKEIVKVPLLEIRKIFSAGDFVEVTGGGYQGETGWVESVSVYADYLASVVKFAHNQKSLTSEDIEV